MPPQRFAHERQAPAAAGASGGLAAPACAAASPGARGGGAQGRGECGAARIDPRDHAVAAMLELQQYPLGLPTDFRLSKNA